MRLSQMGPAQRRILLLLDATSYASLDGSRLAQLQRAHDTQVVSLLDVQSVGDDAVVTGLAEAGLLAAGSVLVQDPFAWDTYIDAAEAEHVAARRKAMLLSRLCQYLGAQSVELESVAKRSSENAHGASVSAKATAVAGTASVSSEERSFNDRLLEIVDVYHGAEPDIAAARRLLAEHHLSHEHDMVHLVDAVEHASNRLQERTIIVSVTREVSRTLESLAELTSVVLPNSVAARYNRVGTERDEVRARYRIRF